jgi:hypothetical protein
MAAGVYTDRAGESKMGTPVQIHEIGVEMNPGHAVAGSDAVILT